MRTAILLALCLNAALLGVIAVELSPTAEAGRPRGPVFTQAQADVLARFSLGEFPWKACNDDEPHEACYTPLLTISGCSVRIAPDPTAPRSLFVGSERITNVFDDLPASGVWVEGSVNATTLSERSW